jgi:hypothetical protein
LRGEEELRMTTHRVSLTFVLLALAVAAYAADIGGKWQWQMQGTSSRTPYTLTLKQDGANLTGTLNSGEDETPIRDGKLTGDKVSFVVARTFGNREMALTYTGRVVGDEIRFKVFMPGAERSWDVTAKRAQ